MRKKLINYLLGSALVFLTIGIVIFIYSTVNGYNINSGFKSVPLNYNYTDSTSSQIYKNIEVKVKGGYVKGIQKDDKGIENILIRALSPIPDFEVKGTNAGPASVMLENISPEFYMGNLGSTGVAKTVEKVAPSTLRFQFDLKAGETKEIKQKEITKETADKNKFVILGDNRDGYDTFEQIIEQVNALRPIFVINNGDLVFSGKPNQYRLFDKVVGKFEVPMFTTLGNHDIRGNGRQIYTKLYGPEYFSFDFGDNYFIFLDSSPAWTQKTAISSEQYTWLENQLNKAKGKKIFVVTHVPPVDPRTGVTKNEIPDLIDKSKNDQGLIEQKLSNYSETMSMNHGFQDPTEAARFESMMKDHGVDTVFLSHIHSYIDTEKDNVRYLITGGAGAELLTKNSYYHYIVSRFDQPRQSTIIELPSPVNTTVARYLATAQLFATAMFEENPVAVANVLFGLIPLVIFIILKIYYWKKDPINKLGKWAVDVGKYSVKEFKEDFDLDKKDDPKN